MTYFPLHVHSHYSLLDGLSKPEQIASRCDDIGVEGSAITDHGTISGHIQFLQKMNKAGKKALLGCEFYICRQSPDIKNKDNRKLAHLCVIAKNDAGWRDIVKMISIANNPDHFYHKPRIDLLTLASFAQKGNIMAFSGHLGSTLANVIIEDNRLALDWKANGVKQAKWLSSVFGRDNFFLEVQLMDQVANPTQKIVADAVRQISIITGIPCVATPDAHYARQEDAEYQRILLCSNLKTTIEQASKPEFGMSGFFRSRQYHIPSFEEMKQWHTEAELDNTLLFASRIEEYKEILRHPVLPKFPCPNGLNADEYLRELCREGWRKKIENKIPKSEHTRYGDRVKQEMKVLQGAGLSSYFLIVKDIMDFVGNNSWLPGPGRGSAAGCLVSYLLGITTIDPMPYDLIFERFYNAGRNTEDRVSMPDIDLDVPKYARESVINYMSNKYGQDRVGQMVTYQTIKGKGAVKDVLRAYGGISAHEMNEITKNLIDDHKISDELQKMKEERGEASIIQWCLENTPKKLEQWCYINDDGSLGGPLAPRFAQAIHLEGTKVVQSKHAAGVVIAPEPLSDMCPLVHDPDTGRMVAAFEMDDLESVGGIKFDILGVTALDKAMGVSQDLCEGTIYEIQRVE